MKTAGWLRGLEVSAGDTGIVSHAGVALLRALSDRTGLTAGLSKALASDRLLIHDRGRVLADLACAVADCAEVISDFRVMTDQAELFGLVVSGPTAWRTLDEIAAGGGRAAGPDHQGGQCGPAARVGGYRGPARRPAGGSGRGQGTGGRDLPAAGCHRGGLPLGEDRG